MSKQSSRISRFFHKLAVNLLIAQTLCVALILLATPAIAMKGPSQALEDMGINPLDPVAVSNANFESEGNYLAAQIYHCQLAHATRPQSQKKCIAYWIDVSRNAQKNGKSFKSEHVSNLKQDKGTNE